MKVLKFGGTSVGTIDSLTGVREIVGSLDQRAVVVVSALGGLTDRLISTAEKAAQGQDTTEETRAFLKRHNDIIETLIDEEDQSRVKEIIKRHIDSLAEAYDEVGRLRKLEGGMLDYIVAFGERMSSEIVAAMLHARRIDSLDVVRTRRLSGGRDQLDAEQTSRLVSEAFNGVEDTVVVMPGFISRDTDTSVITNLGRGGSDFTAAIVAAELDAEILEIWTDVDGFMTADPRMIPTAMVIDAMSMVEAMELCNYGAKVIYPPTIYPVFHKGIPIVIKNTFNPDAPGTLVTDSEKAGAELPIKGVTAIKDVALVTVSMHNPLEAAGLDARIFNSMGRHAMDILFVSRNDDGISFAIKDSEADRGVEVLNKEFALEMATGAISGIKTSKRLAVVAVVGRNIRTMESLPDLLFTMLDKASLKIEGNAYALTETSLTFPVRMDALTETMRLIHDTLFSPQPARARFNPHLTRLFHNSK